MLDEHVVVVPPEALLARVTGVDRLCGVESGGVARQRRAANPLSGDGVCGRRRAAGGNVARSDHRVQWSPQGDRGAELVRAAEPLRNLGVGECWLGVHILAETVGQRHRRLAHLEPEPHVYLCRRAREVPDVAELFERFADDGVLELDRLLGLDDLAVRRPEVRVVGLLEAHLIACRQLLVPDHVLENRLGTGGVDHHVTVVRDRFPVTNRLDTRHRAVLDDLLDHGVEVLVGTQLLHLVEEVLSELVAVDDVAVVRVREHHPHVELPVPPLDLVDRPVDQNRLVVTDGIHVDRTRILLGVSRALYGVATGDEPAPLARLALELDDLGTLCRCGGRREAAGDTTPDDDHLVLCCLTH